MSFIHLHLHTEYSMLDGVQKVPQVLAKCKELEMNSVALTDHGSLYGLFEFWKNCHENGVKPIIGCELYVTSNRLDKSANTQKSYHLPVIAKTLEGYHNLVKLVSKGHLEGFYYKPRVDRELLEEHSAGLIVLSGSKFGEVRSNLELGNVEAAKKTVEWYKNTFKENYYIELTPDLIEGEGGHDQLDILKNFADEFGIQKVATANSYYQNPEDSVAQEIVWALADGKKLVDPSRRKVTTSSHFRTEDEMKALWKDMPEIVDITQKIADEIEDINIGYGKVEPKCIDVPEGKTSESWIRELAYEGAEVKFLNDKVTELPQKVIDRLEYELKIINDKGYNDYFLVVREYVHWANNNNIPTTCRGSGASSLVAYCIEITPLDPLRWKLPFERFLNPERPSFPDFDIDFRDDKRELVFAHMIEKYGIENTCNICAIGRMKSRAVLKDVGRVMDVPLQITDKLSKLVTVKFGKPASLKEMMDPALHPEFAQMVADSAELQELVKISSKIENNARHVSTHACGFIYVPQSVSNLIPIQKESRGGERIISQIEGVKMEPLGLMKFDFLGVANLASIAIAVQLIKERHGVELNMRQIPEDDKPTFKLLQNTDTAGVFQLESDGMRKYLRDLKPTKVEDISFMCAAYRPGPMMFIEPYIKRKHGKEEVTYPHEVLQPILEETYGYAIYQEQVMQIAQAFSGYSLGAADMLRRAMGKKDHKVMEIEKGKFFEGAIKMGHTQEEAEVIFSYLLPFADYGFNKAHSAAYAMIAYQTAYLKANYTIEFIAALMQSDIEKPDKLIRDMEEAKSHGIEVLAPDVNSSLEDFTIVDDKTILFGLAGLKGVGRGQVTELVQKRKEVGGKFKSLEHLLESIDLHKVSKSALELMAKVGAMKEFGNRAQVLEVIPRAIDIVQKVMKQRASGQVDLFGGMTEEPQENIVLSNLEEVSSMQKVMWEKEILGIFLSEHPLIKYQEAFKKIGVTFSNELSQKRGKSRTKIVGIVNSIKEIRTKKDGSLMCFGTIEDPFGVISITVFPRAYITCKDKMPVGSIVLLSGSVDKREDGIGILVNEVKVIDESKMKPDDINAANAEIEKKEREAAAKFNKPNFAYVNSVMQRPSPIPAKPAVPATPVSQSTPSAPVQQPVVQTPVEKSIEEIKKQIEKVVIHLNPATEMEKLQYLSTFFKSVNGNTNLELYFSPEKKVVLKNGIRYDETFKEKILSIIPDSKFEEIS